MTQIDDLEFKEMGDRLTKLLQSNDRHAAQQVAQEMRKKTELMGRRDDKKTRLIREIADKLNAGRVVPKKTQIALEDGVRNVELP